jgi:hypothetical protein
LVFCIFSFKVIVLGVGESGVRVDDPIIFFAYLVLVYRGDLFSVKRSRAFNLYLCFILASFVSTAWSAWHGRVEWVYSTLFVVRMSQYLVFYYIGNSVARMGADLARVLKLYVLVLCLAVPLQMLRILPVPNDFGATRASGNTNGPYELGAVAAFLLCYLGYRNKERFSGIIAFALIILSGARSVLAGAAISLVRIMTPRSKRLMLKSALIALPFFLFGAFLGATGTFSISGSNLDSNSVLLQRFSTATSMGSLADTSAAYEASPGYQSSAEYFEGAFVNAIALARLNEGDASGLMRVFRWSALLKSTLENVDTTLIGLGPSFGTSAVDGYFVRVFVETGVIGLGLFLWFLWSLFSSNQGSPWQFREFVLILMVTAISIDIFVSYKTMLLLWLWHGMNEYQVEKRTNTKRQEPVINSIPLGL